VFTITGMRIHGHRASMQGVTTEHQRLSDTERTTAKRGSTRGGQAGRAKARHRLTRRQL